MMKSKHIILLLTLVALLIACDNDTNTTDLSSDATLKAFSFRSNSAYPGLALATFTIEEKEDIGVVYNTDSLLYGTRIDSVIPSFAFAATPAAAIIYSGDDSIQLTGYDTINFEPRPVQLRVISSDLSNERWYNIYVNVHKVDPDLFTWKRLTESIASFNGGSDKAFFFQGKFFYLFNDGIHTHTYTSSNATTWEEQTTSIPLDCDPRKTLVLDTLLFCPAGDHCYTSSDGITWTTTNITAGFTLENSLFFFNDSLWALAKTDDEKYHFATSLDGNTWSAKTDALPDNFPISDYAAIACQSRSLRQQAVIIGGYDKQGQCLSTRWSIETSTDGQYRYIDYGTTMTYEPIAGSALVLYNDALYLFGGHNENNQIQTDMLQSTDMGYTFTQPDTAHNKLPDIYQHRTQQSVFVHNNYIYIVGGHTNNTFLTDVYRGQLNSISW